MKYYVIAGEASGDLHASNLIKELKTHDSEAQFRCWGGELMEKQGSEVVRHYKDLAFMGFLEVVLNLPTILKNFKFCEQDILSFNPDVVVLVDYPGFNLRIAKFLKEKGIRVFYYISPQVWAWHSSRVNKIKQYVDRMFVILPFEKDFYARWNYEVDFVGHPLMDAVVSRKRNVHFYADNQLENKKIIAILPGSRKQEIQRMLPVMIEMVHLFPGYQFVVAGLTHLGEDFYRGFIHHPQVQLVMDQTYDLLNNAFAAMVTSGTATLETALFHVPQVVCYKGNWLSYFLGKRLVGVDYIALVNLIMGKEVVKELIQSELNAKKLRSALENILEDKQRIEIRSQYQELRQKLGGEGASERAAHLMINYIREST